MEKLSVREYYIVSFLCSNILLQHDQEGSGSKKRCVIDALSRSLPTASRKLLPTENEFRQTRVCLRARAPASPADLEQPPFVPYLVEKTTTCTLNCDKSNSCNYGGCAFFINAFLLKTHPQHIFICYNACIQFIKELNLALKVITFSWQSTIEHRNKNFMT
jgi:hypothetical protein